MPDGMREKRPKGDTAQSFPEAQARVRASLTPKGMTAALMSRSLFVSKIETIGRHSSDLLRKQPYGLVDTTCFLYF